MDGPRDDAAGRALFDLAVARAAAYALRARSPHPRDPAALARSLEVWHLKTRFAARVPLRAIAEALARRPAGEGWTWRGGPAGAWVADLRPTDRPDGDRGA